MIIFFIFLIPIIANAEHTQENGFTFPDCEQIENDLYNQGYGHAIMVYDHVVSGGQYQLWFAKNSITATYSSTLDWTKVKLTDYIKYYYSNGTWQNASPSTGSTELTLNWQSSLVEFVFSWYDIDIVNGDTWTGIGTPDTRLGTPVYVELPTNGKGILINNNSSDILTVELSMDAYATIQDTQDPWNTGYTTQVRTIKNLSYMVPPGKFIELTHLGGSETGISFTQVSGVTYEMLQPAQTASVEFLHPDYWVSINNKNEIQIKATYPTDKSEQFSIQFKGDGSIVKRTKSEHDGMTYEFITYWCNTSNTLNDFYVDLLQGSVVVGSDHTRVAKKDFIDTDNDGNDDDTGEQVFTDDYPSYIDIESPDGSILGYIKYIFDAVTSIFTGAVEMFQSLAQATGSMKNVMADTFSFIPTEIQSVIFLSVLVVILLKIFGR